MSDQNDKSELKTLTIQELRAFSGLSELTDNEALEAIETLKQLSILGYKIINKHESR